MITVNHKENPIAVLSEGISCFFSGWPGVEEFARKMQGQVAEEPSNTKRFIDQKEVLRIAGEWVGHNFRKGETNQCANFVRSVLEEAGLKIGSASKPSDMSLLSPSDTLGPSYANSFAGDDIGLLIKNTSELKPGDIVLFKNTIPGYNEGVITHVGIYEGNGNFVHRPTSSRPVERADLKTYGCFKEGRRLYSK